MPKRIRGVFVYSERKRFGEVSGGALLYVVEQVASANGDSPSLFGDAPRAVGTPLTFDPDREFDALKFSETRKTAI